MPVNFLFSSGSGDGYIGPARQNVTVSTHTTSTIDTFSANVTAVKGTLVMGAGIPVPDFLSASISAATSATLLNAATATATGVSTNFLGTPVLIGGESSTLANGAAVTSSYWNGNGIIRGTVDTGQADLGSVYFVSGGAFTPAVGGALTVWFLPSIDGGTTFETVVATPGTATLALSRSPDAVISLDNAAFAAGNIRFASGRLTNPPPEMEFKTVVQNNSGVAMPATWAVVFGPAAIQQ